MCGIAGIVPHNVNREKFNKALPNITDKLKHRGPDDEGFTFFSPSNTIVAFGNETPDNVRNSQLPYSPKSNISDIDSTYYLGLGHRRLSIIDLSEYGHQPMCDSSKNYWIVFNGEIYNYKELREELVKLGYKFISQTDTEVLLNAYIHWGKDCLLKLNGMWSFVIFNKKTQELFGARDRFGVKPLYYINNSNAFAFASEIKALLDTPELEKKLNHTAIFDYLVSGKLEVDNESFFQEVFELKPSSYFTYNIPERKLNVTSYYELDYNKTWENMGENDIQMVHEKVESAIKNHLVADVEIGTCISGGLDSSVILNVVNRYLKKQNGEPAKAFTAVYPNYVENEEKWAKLVSEYNQSPWFKTTPTSSDLYHQLEDLIYYQDIPFTTSSSFSQYKVMELAHHNNIKVTLDGQGADELFGGYSRHYTAMLHSSIKNLSLTNFFKNFNGQRSNFSNRPDVLLMPLKHLLCKSFPEMYRKRLVNSQPELEYINEGLWHSRLERVNVKNNEFSYSLNELLAKQFTTNTLKHILRLADRNSMRFSIESRTPFVDDYPLVEYLFSISEKNKIQGGVSKFLLREAFKKKLPKEVYERHDKVGFSTPEKEWMRQLRPSFKSIIAEQKDDEFIEWNNLKKHFDHIYDSAIQTDTQRLWRLINFTIWRKVYKV